ncbi:MAG: AraC family ligand binding domain-containing protein, partial [Kiritimatiellae bacterium]|nr:AraC family ligand binding domain-containing protein [Kiritimatiellia bacterium]
FSHAHIGELPFSVYWVSASGEHNADNLNFRNHHHTFCELHVLTDGWIEYILGERCVRLQKGEFLWIPSGCVHRVDGCAAEFVKLTVAFDPHRPIPSEADLLHPCPMSADIAAEAERLFSNASTKASRRAPKGFFFIFCILIRKSKRREGP